MSDLPPSEDQHQGMRNPFIFTCEALKAISNSISLIQAKQSSQDQEFEKVASLFTGLSNDELLDFTYQCVLFANAMATLGSQRSFSEIVNLVKVVDYSSRANILQEFVRLTTGEVSSHTSVGGFKGRFEPIENDTYDQSKLGIDYATWHETVNKEYRERMHVWALLYWYGVRPEQFQSASKDAWVDRKYAEAMGAMMAKISKHASLRGDERDAQAMLDATNAWNRTR